MFSQNLKVNKSEKDRKATEQKYLLSFSICTDETEQPWKSLCDMNYPSLTLLGLLKRQLPPPWWRNRRYSSILQRENFLGR